MSMGEASQVAAAERGSRAMLWNFVSEHLQNIFVVEKLKSQGLAVINSFLRKKINTGGVIRSAKSWKVSKILTNEKYMYSSALREIE